MRYFDMGQLAPLPQGSCRPHHHHGWLRPVVRNQSIKDVDTEMKKPGRHNGVQIGNPWPCKETGHLR
ncbi:hypothetical protein BGZ61DRAFT_179056 [Ilyonectria robusta]|uniref:uncharacterized protein n=1 Tax=Ilyonectria robusta TaxID=1079257 RepID=UPI001E8ED7A5|nr:uncharacterized protein BGZ61DRAFT_179056 [Ilyonectria robusta]KAH8729295.1 hypothetical protein BGZ61DRAFT_179056 [Ilyonectria robusta]